MRKKFILFALIPLAVFALIVYIFIDGWIESALETAGEKVVGAKVEISGLHVSLIPVGLEWSEIQVANPKNPWRNLVQTGEVKFSMDAGQLLRGKYIIDEVEVTGLAIGNKRTSSGALPESNSRVSAASAVESSVIRQAQDALKNATSQSPIFDLTKLKKGFNVDSLIKTFDFSTLKQIDTLKAQVKQTTEQWNAVKSDFEKSKQRLTQVESEIKSINPSSLNNVESITAAVSKVNNAVETVKQISSTASDREKSIESNIKSLSSSVSSLNSYVNSDFQKLKNMARLPSLKAPSVASLLAGSEIYDRAMKYLYWEDVIRTNVKKYSPPKKAENPPRLKGQDIRFPVNRGYPKLWIKKILISGGSDKSDTANFITASGEIDNISSDQTITGLPITAGLKGTHSSGRMFTFTGLFDRTKDIPLDKYTVKLSGVPVGEFKLGKSSFLPSKITDAYMATEVNLTVPGSSFDADMGFKLTNVKVQFDAQPRNIGERIVHDVLSSVNAFDVNFRLWNTNGKFDAALSTDLDDQIAKKLMDALGNEFAKLQNDLKSKFDSYVNSKKAEFEALYNSKIKDIEKQIDSYKSLIESNQKLLDSKKQELIAQLDKQKKGLLDKTLKGLFKKP